MSDPVRTCIGCRRRTEKQTMLRVVWSDGRVIFDERQAAPGRGAYLHPDPKCLAQAAKKRAFGRALRIEGIGADQLAGLTLPAD
ncbi:YlxR family protein [Microlunatus sp. GCM10028923]|uniref:YlxR family protein n=1 Tax=Microlunatus sp. GCM10028923 TaxID=3273400 RepID=UPI00360737E0